VKVTRYSTSGDIEEVCSTDLPVVIRTIAKLGGGYSDVIQAIDEAKSKGFLSARTEVGALPKPGRTYHRSDEGSPGTGDDSLESPDSIPDLFLDRLRRDSHRPEEPVETDFDEP